jgi:hypothetical protein
MLSNELNILKSPHLVLLAAAAVTGTFPLGAVTLLNGSFENLSSSYSNTAGTDSMSGVAADGWSVSTNTPDWFLGAPGPAGLWFTPWGDFFAVGAATDAGYREGISQTISGLTIGQNYAISFQQANGLLFDQASYVGAGTVGGWEVLIDGISVLSSPSTNDNSVPFPAFTTEWSPASALFEATATSQTIEFLAYGGSGVNPTFQFLDSVSVDAVPEPSTSLLVVFGGLALILRRRV